MSHSYYDKKLAHAKFVELYKEKMPAELLHNVRAASQFLKVPYTTLNVMLTENKNVCSFTPDVAIAFCHRFGVNPDAVFYPNDIQSDYEFGRNCTLFKHSSSYHELKDQKYYGTFFGYCQSAKPGHLDSFKLTIQDDSIGHSEAIMELHEYSKVANEVIVKVLTGKPMHLEPRVIHIALQAKEGDDFITLTFPWHNFATQNEKVFYRYGTMLTLQEGTLRHPEMKSFIYLNHPLNEDDLPYADGFLKLTQDKIYITSEALFNEQDGLVSQYPEVDLIVNGLGALERHEVYCFSEDVIIASARAKGLNTIQTANGILRLKQKSLSPSKIAIRTRATFTAFWKSIELKYKTAE